MYAAEEYHPDILDQFKDLPLIVEPPLGPRKFEKLDGSEKALAADRPKEDKPLRYQRRHVGFFSDVVKGYPYSGQVAEAKPLSDYPVLADLLSDVNKDVDASFNGVLVNRFVNGDKYVGCHSDSDEFLDKNHKMTAMLAFGATRTFRIKRKDPRERTLDYEYPSGSLLVMDGEFQNEFTQEMPPRRRVKDESVVLTFRKHMEEIDN